MKRTPYRLVDREHNIWQCPVCGHLAQFEADGPYENGWNMCPHCGNLLTVCGDTGHVDEE